MDFFAVLFHWAMSLQIDEPLAPGALKWLEISEPAEASEAYIYLLGIDAGPNENPVAVGRAEYKKIQTAEHRYLVENKEYVLEELSGPELVLPNFLSTCYRQCIEALYYLPEPEARLKEHQLLRDRTKVFLAYDDYQTLTLDLIESPFPNYQYLVAGNRLIILEALTIARAGNIKQAVELLLQNINGVRNGFSQADNLIHKMIFIVMLSDNIDMLSLMVNDYSINNFIPLTLLTQKEMNFELILANEYAFSHSVLRQISRSPYLFSTTSIDDMLTKNGSIQASRLPTPGWWSRMVFKPNMTSNSTYNVYQAVLAQSEAGAVEFALQVAKAPPRPSVNRVRNIVGSILLDVGSPDIRQYVGRVYDLNAKIVLLNHIAEKGNKKTLLLPSNNPYYEKPSTAYVPENNLNKLCFEGPLPDDRGGRCLTIKISPNPNAKEPK